MSLLGFFLPDDGRLVVRGLLSAGYLAVGAAVLYRRKTMVRRPWALGLLGGLVAVAAAVVSAIETEAGGGVTPFPGYGDVVAWVSGLLILRGAFELLDSRTVEKRVGDIIDALVVALAFVSIVAGTLLAEFLTTSGSSLQAKVATCVYLLVTFTLVYLVARIANGPGERNVSYYLIAAAAGLVVANDVLIRMDVVGVRWAFTAGLIVSPFAFSFAIAGILHPEVVNLTNRPSYLSRNLSTRRIALLGGALVIGPVLFALMHGLGGHSSAPILLGGTGLLSLLVLARFVALVRDRERQADRERQIREAGERITATARSSEIADAVLDIALLTTGQEVDARASLIARSDDGWRVQASVGRDSGEAKGSWLDSDQAAAADAAVESGTSVVGELVTPLDHNDGDQFVFAHPIVDPSRVEVLSVSSPVLIPAEMAWSLGVLARQATLAFAATDYREEVHQQRSEQRFGALMAQNAELVLVTDELGSVRYAGPNAHRVTGHPAATFVGSHAFEIAHPGDRAKLDALLHATVERRVGEVHHKEARLNLVDGSYRWFSLTVRDFRDEPEVAGLVVTARDITEERIAKENLERSEAWFRS
ncbi:MAG: PAS domain S-box protein, partial [bacterium]|nr:PAS domain S-box protein [bacterium]